MDVKTILQNCQNKNAKRATDISGSLWIIVCQGMTIDIF